MSTVPYNYCYHHHHHHHRHYHHHSDLDHSTRLPCTASSLDLETICQPANTCQLALDYLVLVSHLHTLVYEAGKASKETGHIEFLSSAATQVALPLSYIAFLKAFWSLMVVFSFYFFSIFPSCSSSPVPAHSIQRKATAAMRTHLPLLSTSWNDLVGHQGPAYIVLPWTVHCCCTLLPLLILCLAPPS